MRSVQNINFVRLAHQAQAVQLSDMILTGRKQVQAGSVDGAMPQEVCQLYDVPAGLVKNRCKQMAQVVGKHPALLHARRFAQTLHFPPNLLAGNALSLLRAENLAGGYFFFFGVAQQFFPQLPRQQDCPDLSFQPNFSPACHRCFHRQEPQLRHTDTSRANSLHQQSQARLPLLLGSGQKTLVILPGQLSSRLSEDPMLDAQKFYPAILQPRKQ